MERRDLLRSAALGVTLAMLPPMIRRAFAMDGACDERATLVVRESFDRARRRGVALLVLVVPLDDQRRSERGVLFGELIDLGPAIALAAMALSEVVCAPVAAVQCVVPSAGLDPNDEPTFLVVETAEANPVANPIRVDVPPHTPIPDRGLSRDEEIALWDHDVRTRLGRLATALRRALAGADLTRRARQNFRALDTAERQRILATPRDGGGSLPLELVERGAPLLLASVLASRDGEARRRVMTRLAAAARWRLRDHSPNGAQWLRESGCGELYAHESLDDDVGSLACGLGGTSSVAAARLLNFYTVRGR